MVSFPNCKINIGLNITEKRDDGYHNLETIFYPIALKDAVEIISNKKVIHEIALTTSGNQVAGNIEDNICIKAYHLLKKYFPQIPCIKMHLHKNIPMGAGMGGGSANASAVLQMLNTKFNLQINDDELIKYALHLGSDCPFFIINKPCFATGRGEVLQTVSINLSAYKILIINPGIHINTAAAFAQLNASNFSSKGQILPFINDINTWQKNIKNDFEKTVFALHPSIALIKETLYKHDAIYASLSGSGSTVFGIFKDKIDVNKLNFPANYFCQYV